MSDRRQQDTLDEERWCVDKCVDKLLRDAQRSSAFRELLEVEKNGRYNTRVFAEQGRQGEDKG